MGYLALLKRHRGVIGFGFLLAATSSFGQTFFISLFVPHLGPAFGLERADFSSLYGGCTVASAFVIPVLGAKIDDVDLRLYTFLAQLGLALACFGLAFSPSVLPLAFALFCVRMLGQGMMSHIEVTSISRFFRRSRGKALALAMLGHPAGEGAFPSLFTWIITEAGWREAWMVAGGVVLLGLLPTAQLLLMGKDTSPLGFAAHDDDPPPRASAREDGAAREDRPDLTRAQVLRLRGVWLLLPFWLTPAFVLTGTFFHQLALADELGWSHAWLAGSFVAFAVGRSFSSLTAGPLIDRLGARRLVPWVVMPLAFALAPLFFLEGVGWAPWYLAMSGISIGLAGSVRSAWLADAMGVSHLGSIRSLLFPLGVLSTAAAPPLFGLALDEGIGMSVLCGLGALLSVGATALAWLGFRLVDSSLRRLGP